MDTWQNLNRICGLHGSAVSVLICWFEWFYLWLLKITSLFWGSTHWSSLGWNGIMSEFCSQTNWFIKRVTTVCVCLYVCLEKREREIWNKYAKMLTTGIKGYRSSLFFALFSKLKIFENELWKIKPITQLFSLDLRQSFK